MAGRIDWEDPEIMDWESDAVRSEDDRCLPALALLTVVGAYASSCRPRYYGCRPRYYYGYYYCRPRYYYGYGCRPTYYDYDYFRTCYPRPCRPV